MRVDKTSTKAFVPMVTLTITTTSTVEDVVTEQCIIRSSLPLSDPLDASMQYSNSIQPSSTIKSSDDEYRIRILDATASTRTTITEKVTGTHTPVPIAIDSEDERQTTPQEDDVKVEDED